MPDFYRSLDAMFYRTGDFFEAYGRVVVEAMARACPWWRMCAVVMPKSMEDGVSGFGSSSRRNRL
jgi:hypothetical protein